MLGDTVNSNSVFSTKYAELSTKQQVLIHFHNPTCAYNTTCNLHQKSVIVLQSILTSLFHPSLFTKLCLQLLLIPRLIIFGILQVMKMMKISDENACNRNDKLSSSPCLIPSIYCHYFHTLLIPPRKLAFPWKPVASLNFHLIFSILIHYSCPSSPICLEIVPSYSSFKVGSITLSLHFGIRSQQQANKPKDLKICEYNI